LRVYYTVYLLVKHGKTIENVWVLCSFMFFNDYDKTIHNFRVWEKGNNIW
jgi:hypothetical protein